MFSPLRKMLTGHLKAFGHKTPERRKESATGTGYEGENLAAAFLRAKGLTILERNYACARGEIDIIAFHRGTVVFVEVKFRASPDAPDPVTAVGETKQTRLKAAAAHYIAAKKLMERNIGARIDVLGIRKEASGNFSYDYRTDALEAPQIIT
ncbi:MAG TPA: YraN family protein [Candidatus Brocadiia bacterium]|nr:YraN family protein [Candidatus Brocadiia bacterium]